MGQRNYSFDIAMLLKDAGLVAASAAAQVGGVNQILDLGVGRFEGMAVIDVAAIEIATGNEEYDLVIQGSSSATFASDIQNLAQMQLGATGSRDGSGVDSLVGRYELPFINEQADVRYRYLRLYTVAAGTIATGINYTAFVAPLDA